MREIKFRAWDKENSEMIYPDSKNNEASPLEYIIDAWCDSESETTILTQYTGLKDKNGKEIFEGDIVSDSRSDDCIDIIEWQGYGFGVRYYDESDNALEVPEYWEVIGDVYQNKDLLQ